MTDDAPTGEPTVLPIVDGVATWSGVGRVRLALTYAARRGFDYFNRDACAALIDTIHGEFDRHVGEYLGDVIVGSFQDELPSMPLWGTTFADALATAHGYDPVPLLDGLFERHRQDTRRLRHDYHARGRRWGTGVLQAAVRLARGSEPAPRGRPATPGAHRETPKAGSGSTPTI